jgi:hypothetical protein
VASVEEFLRQNPDLEYEDDASPAESTGLRLAVAVTGVSSRFLRFNHLGTDYVVEQEDVLDIAEREDPSAAGTPATLTLKHDAELFASFSVSARDLTGELPFSLARGPSLPLRRPVPSAREVAWRRATAYADFDPGHPFKSLYDQTLTGCDSVSAGELDDSKTDDERADW